MFDETTATVEAPAAPKAPAKKKAPKATKKKAPKATAKPSKNGRGPTVRQRVFALIGKRPLTGPAIMEKLGLSGVPSFLKDEVFGTKPRIKRTVEEDVRGVLYGLTAAGKADLEAGRVDENAAPPSGGKEIPHGR